MAKKFKDLADACWAGYKAVGLKDKNGKKVPNCVKESSEEEHEIGIDHRDSDDKTAKKHIESVIKKHGLQATGASDKETYFKVHKDKVEAVKRDLKAGRVHSSHWINGDWKEETILEVDEVQSADYKLSKSGRKIRARHIVFHNQDDDQKTDKEKEMKESVDKSKATVETKKYSWGTMKTVHHGSSFSIPLHPEHHHEIAKLKDEQEHHFKDETGRHWTARRKGDDVHFQGANGGNSTTVKHSTMKEETGMLSFKEKLNELSKATMKSYVEKGIVKGMKDAREGKGDISKKREAGLNKAMAKVYAKEEVDLDEAKSPTAGTRLVKKYGSDEHRAEVRYSPDYQEYQVHHYKNGKHMGEGPVSYHGDDKQDAHDTAKHEADKRATVKEETEQLDEISKKTTGEYIRSAAQDKMMAANNLGVQGSKLSIPDAQKLIGKINKRTAGIDKAVSRLTKEEVEQINEDDFYGAAQKHLDLASNAKRKGDQAKYHLHMADHHDYMTQWHDSKGRGREAEKHADKAAGHEQAAHDIKEEVELQEATDKMQQLRDAHARHEKKALEANRNGDDEKTKIHQQYMGKIQDKMAKLVRNEEVQLDEANHREFAAQGKMHPDMAKHMETGREMDFYAKGTGDKMSGKVIKNDGKQVHVQVTHNPYKEKDSSVHKFSVTNKLDEAYDSPLDTPAAKKAREELKKVLLDIKKKNPNHPAVQDVKEEVRKSDIPAYLRKKNGDKPLTVADAKAPRKDSISHKDNLAKQRNEDFEQGEVEGSMKSYKDFVQSLNEYNSTDGSYRHKGNYGGSHQETDEDDEDDKPKSKPASTEKRGRGRPKGSSSGARQQGTK